MSYLAHHGVRSDIQVLAHAQNVARLLGRCALFILCLPLLPQAVFAVLIYRRVHKDLLEIIEGTWEPAFPPIWTAYIALLYTIPLFAGAQLAWLLSTRAIGWFFGRRRRSAAAARERDGYMMLNTGGGGSSVGSGAEDDEKPEAPARLHRLRRRLPRVATLFWAVQCVICAGTLLYGLYHYHHYEAPGDVRYRPALQRALADPHPKRTGYAPRPEKIFIAAAFHQNEAVLPYWTKTMLDVIAYLGPDNVFVSVVENYSSDRSPELLRAFAGELDARHIQSRIQVQNETVKRPPDLSGNARIEFLAAIRNQALEPLLSTGGYDRVLFSNDVFVEPESVLELLDTRGGAYDFACGLDFGHFGAYDMWVLRDAAGRLTAAYWPFFDAPASAAAMRADEPVPVFACWNGIVAFAADPLLPVHLRSNRTLSTDPLAHAPPAGHPWAAAAAEAGSPAATAPLRFRASVEGECYSSESFLLPYDFRRVMGLERVYANPRVITGYVWKYYAWHKWLLRSRHVRWFVEKVYAGAWMQDARMVVGDKEKVWVWDGVDCHPWW